MCLFFVLVHSFMVRLFRKIAFLMLVVKQLLEIVSSYPAHTFKHIVTVCFLLRTNKKTPWPKMRFIPFLEGLVKTHKKQK